ncbi:MAG: hypothetical protein HWE21_10350 [Cytophagia bacterium]|nr:hypothetical protein [Cytophagia bacterium]NVK84712.1 hypothetical protein [Cytophagia bacterium]
MNKSEKEFDVLIQEALSKEEAKYFDEMAEQNVPQMVLGLFKGKNSWLNIVMIVVNLGVFGIGIYTFTEMLKTESTNLKLEWMFYTLMCFLMMVLFKLWSWNQMDRNALMREIKRLEYQVSLLSKKKN